MILDAALQSTTETNRVTLTDIVPLPAGLDLMSKGVVNVPPDTTCQQSIWIRIHERLQVSKLRFFYQIQVFVSNIRDLSGDLQIISC